MAVAPSYCNAVTLKAQYFKSGAAEDTVSGFELETGGSPVFKKALPFVQQYCMASVVPLGEGAA